MKAKTLWALGPRRLALFAWHVVNAKTRAYERATPLGDWPTIPDAGTAPFPAIDYVLVRSQQHDLDTLTDAVARLATGQLRYYGHEWRERPADWVDAPSPNAPHWSRISAQSGPAIGDLKDHWEPSRFDWVFLLLRAHAAGIVEAEPTFWALFEDWCEHNPPNRGLAWLCAQETSLRGVALIWAAHVFRPTGAQAMRLWSVVVASAQRVEPSLAYALAQHNNHGISEAVFLFLAGLSLPTHLSAARWRDRGRRLLERQVNEQFATDGSYVQHSFNYQRMATRLVVHAMVAAKHVGVELDPIVRTRIEAAARFLHAHLNLPSGRVPNYGANDGANPLNLSGTEYLDYRALIGAAFWASEGRRRLEPGPWDEELAWLFGKDALVASVHALEQHSQRWEPSGHVVLRADDGMVAMRAPRFRSRPAHADALHVDLWVGKENVLRDGGSYRYWDPDGVGVSLAETSAHNTLCVEGQSQMPRLGRFLYGDWLQSRIDSYSSESVTASHDGYRSRFGVRHTRSVQLLGRCRQIVDTAEVEGEPRLLQVRWRLARSHAWRPVEDGLFRSDPLDLWLLIKSPGTVEFKSGLESLHYGAVQQTDELLVSATTGSTTFVTMIGPDAAELAELAKQVTP